ncbi:MAG TPA: hypothetical protein VLT17_02560 [Gemmatimonadales bacterium]|jgi:hypothetical protein|nr:hypothetical protein [Gemmatimonadales bacterium]
MILTIMVERVLRETVQVPYRDLVTRSTGAAVRTGIERAIAEGGCATTLLDFSEVGLLDFSCADEVVAKLLLRTQTEDDRYVVLSGLREEHFEAIDHVLNHHQIAVLAKVEAEAAPRALGRLAPELQDALAAAQQLETGDAESLADAIGWTVEHAADALQSLALLRLLCADQGHFRRIPLT